MPIGIGESTKTGELPELIQLPSGRRTSRIG
jgi:hypothetical protein